MGLGFPKSQIPYGKSHSGISHEEPLTEADMRDALLSNLSFMKSKPKKKSK